MYPESVTGGNRTTLIWTMITSGARNRMISRLTGANRIPSTPRRGPRVRRGVTASVLPDGRHQVFSAPCAISLPAIAWTPPPRARSSHTARAISATWTTEMRVEIAFTTAV